MVQDTMEELSRVQNPQGFVGHIREFYFYLESNVESLKCLSITHSDTHFFFFFFNYLFIYLFIYGCVGPSFLCEGFLQLRRAGTTLHRGARASHYRGLSCCGAQAPDAQAQ